MKRVRIAKYTKEKKKAAKERYNAEQKKIKYGKLDGLKYIFDIAWKRHKPMLFCAFGAVLFENITQICAVFQDKYVVELAFGTSDRIMLALIVGGLILARNLLRFGSNFCHYYNGNIGSFKFVRDTNMLLVRKNMQTDYENNERSSVNDTMQKAYTGSDYISSTAVNTLRSFLGNLLMILSLGTILSMLNPIIVLLVGVPSFVNYYINKHKMRWIWNMADNWQNYERQFGYINRAASNFSYAKDVRLFNMPLFFKQLYDRAIERRLNWYEQQDEWSFRHEIAVSIWQNIANFLSYAYVIWLVYSKSIGAGDFVLFFGCITLLANAVYNIFDNYSGFQWLANNISFAREYLEIPDTTNRENGEPLPTSDFEIEFRNVSYTYYKADEPTIKNLSFTLHKGERLALVGLNGAGKTTLIKLICGLYDPTEGEIFLNGKPVNAYNRDEYFTLFSAVFQDIAELPVSIAENISGVPYEQTDKERLTKCLKQAGLFEKIESLPDKEKTHLVRSLYDDAIELSGGQKQKMALAKALYKNAPILLLDEPTAALDPIAEQEMYLQYADFSKSKASVFISHRLASTRFCDRIILLDNGEIAEIGTHSELMAMKCKYAELFELQSSYYNDEEVQDFE